VLYREVQPRVIDAAGVVLPGIERLYLFPAWASRSLSRLLYQIVHRGSMSIPSFGQEVFRTSLGIERGRL